MVHFKKILSSAAICAAIENKSLLTSFGRKQKFLSCFYNKLWKFSLRQHVSPLIKTDFVPYACLGMNSPTIWVDVFRLWGYCLLIIGEVENLSSLPNLKQANSSIMKRCLFVPEYGWEGNYLFFLNDNPLRYLKKAEVVITIDIKLLTE